ncbi:MAG: PTS sugar transporter subunit IIA, partial [Acidimicrobiia bacterium]|nr:PTS sugar transporter subunit IIA [Acidimicrobiia bacterium]
MPTTDETPVLDKAYIAVGCESVDRDTAIKAAADMLAARGLVDDTYGAAMLKREETVSTYMGNGVALPHG